MMQPANLCDIIHAMAEQERPSRRNRRENIELLIKAIHKRFDVTRGGPKYLADITPTSFTYLSAVMNNARGCGNELSEKIERAFRLPQGWLDDAHLDADLDELATKHVPLRPGARIGRKAPKKRASDMDEMARLRQIVEQLSAQVAEIANKPK